MIGILAGHEGGIDFMTMFRNQLVTGAVTVGSRATSRTYAGRWTAK